MVRYKCFICEKTYLGKGHYDLLLEHCLCQHCYRIKKYRLVKDKEFLNERNTIILEKIHSMLAMFEDTDYVVLFAEHTATIVSMDETIFTAHRIQKVLEKNGLVTESICGNRFFFNI